jgi:hypothetical protein
VIWALWALGSFIVGGFAGACAAVYVATQAPHRHCDLCGYPAFSSMLKHYETNCRMPGHARERAKELRASMPLGGDA